MMTVEQRHLARVGLLSVRVDDERERHHGQKSWSERGTKGASQAAKCNQRKNTKNWRDNSETLHIVKAPPPRYAWAKLFTELERCRSRHSTSDAESGTKTA